MTKNGLIINIEEVFGFYEKPICDRTLNMSPEITGVRKSRGQVLHFAHDEIYSGLQS
jgi:hypothetical protein